MTHEEILNMLIMKINAREGAAYNILDLGDDFFTLTHSNNLRMTAYWERILEDLIRLV